MDSRGQRARSVSAAETEIIPRKETAQLGLETRRQPWRGGAEAHTVQYPSHGCCSKHKKRGKGNTTKHPPVPPDCRVAFSKNSARRCTAQGSFGSLLRPGRGSRVFALCWPADSGCGVRGPPGRDAFAPREALYVLAWCPRDVGCAAWQRTRGASEDHGK